MRRKLGAAALLLAVSLVVLAAAAVATPARTARSADRHYVMKVLVRGAPLHQANGIWADGRRLYVATVAGGQIAVLDARNGHVLRRIQQATSDDVTMGPDGSLYWTDLLEGQVVRMTPDGDVTRQGVPSDAGPIPGVNAITFSADGRLFVAQAILPFGDALYELDPALQDPPQLIWDPGDGYPFLQQLNGFDFGPDGMLFAPQPYLGRVVRIDVDATPVVPQVVAEGMSFPSAVKFDSHGRLFAVASARNGQVLRIDVQTGTVRLVSTVPTGLAGVDNLAFGPRDRLYCTGAADGSVWQILPAAYGRATASRCTWATCPATSSSTRAPDASWTPSGSRSRAVSSRCPSRSAPTDASWC
jgi:sugar lactone lactonase YvrE